MANNNTLLVSPVSASIARQDQLNYPKVSLYFLAHADQDNVVLLDYQIPRSAIMGKQDIDFTDVFGGPPTTHERRSYSSAFVGNCQTHAFSCSDRWSGVKELPLFGSTPCKDMDSQDHDFFNDIFRGRNSKSLNSKSHSARFSVPAPWTNERDLTKCAPKNYAFDSSNSICSSNTSLLQSSRVNRIDQEPDSRVSLDYCPVPLPGEPFPRAYKSFNSIGLNRTRYSMEDSTIMIDAKHGEKYNLSIDTQASEEISLEIPLKETDHGSRARFACRISDSNRLIESDSMNLESPLVTPSNSGFSSSSDGTTIISLHELVGKQGPDLLDMDDSSFQIKAEPSQMVKDTILSLHELETMGGFCINEKVPTDITIMGETKAHDLPPSRYQNLQKEAAVEMRKAYKAESKPLHAFLSEEDDEPDDDGIKEGKEGGHKRKSTKQQDMEGSTDAHLNMNKQDEKARTLTDGEETRSTIEGYLKSNALQNRVKGKAKELIKIFNREVHSKQTSKMNSKNMTFRRKMSFSADEAYPRSSGSNGKTHIHTRRSMTVEGSSFMGEECRKERKCPSTFSTDHLLSKHSGSKIGSSLNSPLNEKHVLGDMDDPFLGNFEIEELKPDEYAQLEASDDDEQNKAIDAKVRQWSHGKEHNIRSLLSTLQYVLWPENGWKVVRLADIIEEPAVKRSYQRALLCLHPDKLQQKGAASDQRYIARQVYEILQEAWSHTLSLDST